MRRHLLSATCGLLVLAAPASAAPPGGWCKRNTSTVARNPHVVVYLGGRDDSGRALCARYRGRRPLIVGEEGYDAVRASGRHVFVAAVDPEEGRESADVYLYATLFDVARRTRRHRWRFFQFNGAPVPLSVHNARVLRNGSTAFAVTGVHAAGAGEHVTEIHSTSGPYRELLARGTDVDARSLRDEGEWLIWTEGGVERRAPFG